MAPFVAVDIKPALRGESKQLHSQRPELCNISQATAFSSKIRLARYAEVKPGEKDGVRRQARLREEGARHEKGF